MTVELILGVSDGYSDCSSGTGEGSETRCVEVFYFFRLMLGVDSEGGMTSFLNCSLGSSLCRLIIFS